MGREESGTDAVLLSLVYIGRIARETGIGDVIYGLRWASDRGASARLAIAGGGEDENCLRQLADRAGLARHVSFHGPVFGEARLQLLQLADVSVLPQGGTGLLYTLYCSLVAGVPVMGRRSDSAGDAIVDRVNGLLLPPGGPEVYGRAICELAADRAFLGRMRAACRERRSALAA
jgi:glycosyltransferase involved in cell wall biosynthesis